MAKYTFQNVQNASLTLDFITIYAPASAMRRAKVYDFTLGATAAAADTTYQWQLFRTTAAPGTPVAGGGLLALDGADAAAVTLTSTIPTSNGTHAANALMSIGLNQRATFRWVAAPGSEIVIPATAGHGVAWSTLGVSPTTATSGTTLVEEQ